MPVLSKSKLIAYRQCPKRLWLEVHRPELREDSSATQASFATGHRVGDLARKLYDPKKKGSFLDLQALGVGGVIDATRELLPQRRMIFEAGFCIGNRKRGALALADILQPHRDGRSWNMVEVKSSTKVHAYHEDDAAIQYHIATQAGISLKSIKVAHVDNQWVYPGGEDFRGLLVEQDVTETAATRSTEVARWLSDAHKIVASPTPPEQPMGAHCGSPFACGFESACRSEDEAAHGVAVHPVRWLPMQGARKSLKTFLDEEQPRSMLEVDDELLNVRQLRVKQTHAAGSTYFDKEAAAAQLRAHSLPAFFLDFETVTQAVPLWKGTRPYQQVPFQFSLHRLSRTGKLLHWGFLDFAGQDPSPAIANALVSLCGAREPIFAYNSSFEGTRLRELSERFPRLASGLNDIRERLVDLRPVAESCFYDPRQEGSWSIKQVLPAIAPDLDYSQLEGVKEGGAAAAAYAEAIDPHTSPQRRMEIRAQLWRYCRLDTYAMVRLWAFLAGRVGFGPETDDCSCEDVTP